MEINSNNYNKVMTDKKLSNESKLIYAYFLMEEILNGKEEIDIDVCCEDLEMSRKEFFYYFYELTIKHYTQPGD